MLAGRPLHTAGIIKTQLWLLLGIILLLRHQLIQLSNITNSRCGHFTSTQASLCSLLPSNTVDRSQLIHKKVLILIQNFSAYSSVNRDKVAMVMAYFRSSVQMKPGIIRPMTAIPRLRVEDEEGHEQDAFQHFDVRGFSGDTRKVF